MIYLVILAAGVLLMFLGMIVVAKEKEDKVRQRKYAMIAAAGAALALFGLVQWLRLL